MRNIINISNDNLDKATETLYLAFADDPFILWMFDGRENYTKNGRWAFTTWIKWSMLYGIAIATPNCEAIALRKKPGEHKFSFWGLWRSGMLKTPMIMGSAAFEKIKIVDNLFKAEQLKNIGSDNFWYCWMIGTHPNYRQQGFSKRLMSYTFDLAKKSKLPCYLETATKKNVIIHGKQGYNVNSTIDIPDSEIKIYCMSKLV